MTPFEKGHFNATQKKKIKIKGSDPSSMIRVSGTTDDEDKKYFEEKKKKEKKPKTKNIQHDKSAEFQVHHRLGYT